MKCYLCEKDIKGPEGAIHPAGGFGWRHLNCDPQEFVQQLDKTESGDAESRVRATKSGDVELSPFGALLAARQEADVARQRREASGGAK